MYKEANDDDTAHKFIEKIKEISGEETSKLTFKDALFDPRYRRATWINIVYVCFHELAGNSLINLYCNRIFKTMDENGNQFVTPRQGTMMVGAVSFVSSLFSTQLVRCFGRKTLLLWGHAAIAIFHASIAVCNIYDIEAGVVIMTMMF